MKRLEVVCGLFVQAGKIGAFQRNERGNVAGLWEFPGGKIDAVETGQEALCRELMEELAVEVEVGRELCSVNWDYPEVSIRLSCYQLIGWEGKFQLLEHQAMVWLKVADIYSVEWAPADKELIYELEQLGVL